MSRLVWDQTGNKLYETGVEMGVLFPTNTAGAYQKGVAWDGLISVSKNPTGGESNKFYANNKAYLNIMSAEELEGSISAYTYPDEFAACNGEKELAPGLTASQQVRMPFGMAFKTLIGNDTENNKHGYNLHIIWGAKVSPSERTYSTVNESPEPMEMSWDYTTTKEDVPGAEPTSTFTVNSLTADADCLKALEDALFGRDADTENSIAAVESHLPTPAEVIAMLTPAAA